MFLRPSTSAAQCGLLIFTSEPDAGFIPPLLSPSEVPGSFQIIIPPVSDGAAPSLNSVSAKLVFYESS